MTSKKILKSAFILAIVLSLSSCMQNKTEQKTNTTPEVTQPAITKAICVIHPTEGNKVTGTVTFMKMDGGIHVIADISGLTEGKHGFHIHEYGDCSASDGSSAGGHFNPDNKPHGGPTDLNRHVGDLGNITADANGNAHFEITDTLLSFQGAHSIIGRGIIIHAGEDDLKSQPSGNAGARVACGVIGIAKE